MSEKSSKGVSFATPRIRIGTVSALLVCVCVLAIAVGMVSKQQTQRKQELSNAISAEETSYHIQTGYRYFIPISDQNVSIVMQKIQAKDSERAFVISEMKKWAELQRVILPTIPINGGGNGGGNGLDCNFWWQRCNSACRSMIILDSDDSAKQSACFDECNARKASCEAGQP
jgi:hypothetical protein